MPAYMIANVRFTDAQKAMEYGRQVAATIEQYGGRYLVRGGAAEVVEGAWPLHYLVLVEFPSLEQARRPYASSEYGRIKALRQEHAETQLAFVDGIPSG